MNQVKFVDKDLKIAFKKFEGIWSALGSLYPLNFFKGCLPKILLGPLLNTLTHL